MVNGYTGKVETVAAGLELKQRLVTLPGRTPYKVWDLFVNGVMFTALKGTKGAAVAYALTLKGGQ